MTVNTISMLIFLIIIQCESVKSIAKIFVEIQISVNWLPVSEYVYVVVVK